MNRLNKFATAFLGVLFCTAPCALAQPGSYLGPGILSRGAGNLGYRGGEQVDLRFYADATASYDTGLQPFSLDQNGKLATINGLYGIQADLGAYGTHRWRQAMLGLDYIGSFTHYPGTSTYDTTNQSLKLGYTYQKSRRIAFDFREVAGVAKTGYGSAGFYGSSADGQFVNSPTALLFDNRYEYFQSTMDVTFIQSAKTMYTMGGDGFFVRRQAKALAGTNGYNLRGSVMHRLDRQRTIGASYEHIHFDFPPAFGESEINVAELFFSTGIGRRWTFSVSAGAFYSEVQGVEQVALDPVIAALLGTSTGQRAFYRRSISPSGRIALRGQAGRSGTVTLSYGQEVTPGNGLYLTSQQKAGTGSYTYSGIRNWSFGIAGGYQELNGIGQGLKPYHSVTGGLNASYRLTGAVHLIARFDARDQQIDALGFRHTGYRTSFGIAFSPGDIPLSLW